MSGGRESNAGTPVTPYFSDPDVTLYQGDSLEVLRELPSGSVHMACTSPPFFGLRDYGTGAWEGGDEGCDHSAVKIKTRFDYDLSEKQQSNAGSDVPRYGPECPCGARRIDSQIGLESSPDEWATRLVDVFREVRRVLRDDGTLWVECGDSYGAPNSGSSAKRVDGGTPYRIDGLSVSHPTKPKDLIGQPWLLAQKLRDPYYTGRIKDERDRIWLAAIIDGEGCIHIHKRSAGDSSYSRFRKKDGVEVEYVRKNDTYGVMVAVSNTDKSLIERCQRITGYGSICEKAPRPGQRNLRLWTWSITGQQSREVLREVYEHLMGKQRQARIAIACPSADAALYHDAIKDLHNGRDTTFDCKPPESLYEPGWYLRSCITWVKPNAMPQSVTDRPTTGHSYVFLFSKRPRYFYDAEALREPAEYGYSDWGSSGRTRYDAGTDGIRGLSTAIAAKTPNANRNARSVWTIPTEPNALAICRVCDAYWQGGAPRKHCGEKPAAERLARFQREHPNLYALLVRSPTKRRELFARLEDKYGEPVVQHFAAFPRELVRRMILAGTSEKGVCAECGAPWVREVEVVPATDTLRSHETNPGAKHLQGSASRLNSGTAEQYHANRRRLNNIGWNPSCACSRSGFGLAHNAVPATVLDPFSGSGTSLLVARQLGRHAVGIELNERYAAMTRARLSQLSLLSELVS